MFDFDDLAEDLGGPNKAAIEVEAAADAQAAIEARAHSERRSCVPAAVAEEAWVEPATLPPRKQAVAASAAPRWQEQIEKVKSTSGAAPTPGPGPSAAGTRRTAPRDSQLSAAVRSGCPQRVGMLLRQGRNPNDADDFGETPLFAAARAGNAEIVAALLHAAADPSRRSLEHAVAAEVAEDPVTRALLEAFSGVNGVDMSMFSAVASSVGDLYRPFVVQRLQECREKAAPSPPLNGRRERPEAAAAPRQPWKQAQLQQRQLVQPSAPAPASRRPLSDGTVELFEAARLGNERRARLLLQGRADPNAEDDGGETPLFAACAGGHADAVAALLLHRADPSRSSIMGARPMEVAATGATRGLLQFFLGAELTAEQHGFLLDSLEAAPQRAALLDLVRIREASRFGLLDAGQEVPPDDRDDLVAQGLGRSAGDTSNLSQDPLARAVRDGDLEEVWRLLADGADPNAPDELGETPLFEAAATGIADITAALLLCRADPDRRSFTGGSAADLATDSVGKALLSFFARGDLEAAQQRSVTQAVRDPSVREQLEHRFRDRGMKSALQHTLRKLRA